MDLSLLGTLGTGSSPKSRKGSKAKGGKSKGNTKAEEGKSISEQIWERMNTKPNLRHLGKREKGEVAEYQAKQTFADQQREVEREALIAKLKTRNMDSVIHYVTDLSRIPGGFKYLGGFLIKITQDETRIILPRGCTGEHLANWRIYYEEVLINMKNQIREV